MTTSSQIDALKRDLQKEEADLSHAKQEASEIQEKIDSENEELKALEEELREVERRLSELRTEIPRKKSSVANNTIAKNRAEGNAQKIASDIQSSKEKIEKMISELGE